LLLNISSRCSAFRFGHSPAYLHACVPTCLPAAQGIYYDMWQMQRAQQVLEEHLHPGEYQQPEDVAATALANGAAT
jgi:hypothetical protein